MRWSVNLAVACGPIFGPVCLLASPPDATLEITRQPSNVVALVASAVTFSVAARASVAGDTNPPIAYQWQQLDPGQTVWADIAGANQSNYTTNFWSCTQTGTGFRCRLDLPGATALSETATVYVFADDLYPVLIRQQPQSQLALEQCPATFNVIAEGFVGFPPRGPSYQWFKDGLAIDGATGATYTTPPVTVSDNGSRFWVVVSNVCGAVKSDEALLVVSLDVVPPVPHRAVGGSALNTVAVYFAVAGGVGCTAKQLDPISVTDVANYHLSGGLVLSNAMLAPGGTNILLTTSQQTPGVEYTLSIEGVRDLSGNAVPAGSQLTFWGWAPIRVSIQGVGTNAVISWQPPIGTLEIAPAVTGPWAPMPYATSPYPIFVPTEARFYQVIAPP